MNESRHSGGGSGSWELIVQPGERVAPLLEAIGQAKKRVEILIFRFDKREIEEALVACVKRGVAVTALIAWTNSGGERSLRSLETRLLAAGVTVSRTADDLTRYHGKMLIIDRKRLYLLAFNFTSIDIDSSRSFGVSTTSRILVDDAVRLFEADCGRQPFTPSKGGLLVSPINAREEITRFISDAKKELLIYDPCVSDPRIVRLLEDRASAGVQVRILGSLKGSRGAIAARPLADMRLHTRTIVRDDCDAFLGSQSLRTAELDGRREIGAFLSCRAVVAEMKRNFEADWSLTDTADEKASALSGDKLAKKIAKAISKELPPITEVVQAVTARMPANAVDLSGIDMPALEETIRSAVKTVVKESFEEAAADAAQGAG